MYLSPEVYELRRNFDLLPNQGKEESTTTSAAYG